jgi:hypothetical protein
MADRIRDGVGMEPVPLRLVLGSQALAMLLAWHASRALLATVGSVVIGVEIALVITHALLGRH